MSRPAVRSDFAGPLPGPGEPIRVAFAGPPVWLEACQPSSTPRLLSRRFELGGASREDELAALRAYRPDVTVLIDPTWLAAELIEELPGLRLGMLVGGLPPSGQGASLARLDRVVSFDPALTGVELERGEVWRAVPPPVADRYFAPVRPLHGAPRAISLGRSSDYRETILLPAKHHHDLLQAISGLSGELLVEALAAHDVGVYVSPTAHGSFGLQVGLHLAAGQLLLSTPLRPAHGLEREIDYLQLESPEGLVWMLDRITRFPEMHQRVRVRGRMKAEQYRSSRLFMRLAEDLLRDVAAFGRGGAPAA
jgi:hypothetical protein